MTFADNGDELAAWRKDQHLNRHDLAVMLGVTFQTISNWERGVTPVPLMAKLAIETITGQRQMAMRRLRLAQERLTHERRMAMIDQGLLDARPVVKQPGGPKRGRPPKNRA